MLNNNILTYIHGEKIMMSFFKKLIEARERAARYKAAQILQRSEFPNDSVEYVYEQLQNGSLWR
jgi:hypothetical protein